MADCLVNFTGAGCNNTTCQAMPFAVPIRETSTWYIEGSTVPQGSIYPGDNANGNDTNLINKCLSECSNTNCQSMPAVKNWGRDVPWFDMFWAEMINPFATFTPDDLLALGACIVGPGAGTDLICQAVPQYERYWKTGNTWYDEMQTALALPPPAADLALLSDCNTKCSNQDPIADVNLACQAMPRIDVSTCGIQYLQNDPATFLATDCDPIDPLTLMTHPNNNGSPPLLVGWRDDIINGISLVNPMCDLIEGDYPLPDTDISNNGWLQNVERSWVEADNQVAKFRQRRDFLQNRLTELDANVAMFDQADQEFDAFLNDPVGPVQTFMNDVCLVLNVSEEDRPLPFQAVYVWQDEPTGNRPAPNQNVGYFSATKVEARIPKRCENGCGIGGGADPRWPWIRTWTRRWGTIRCFELTDTSGMVKFRVTRFDQSRDPSIATFPNGQKIWDFRYFHPDTGVIDPGNLFNPTASNSDCRDLMIPDPPGIPAGVRNVYGDFGNIYAGALLMGKRITDNTDPDFNVDCWDRVDGLLRGGVKTEVCAQYYFQGGSAASQTSGFSHIFVDCGNTFPWRNN